MPLNCILSSQLWKPSSKTLIIAVLTKLMLQVIRLGASKNSSCLALCLRPCKIGTKSNAQQVQQIVLPNLLLYISWVCLTNMNLIKFKVKIPDSLNSFAKLWLQTPQFRVSMLFKSFSYFYLQNVFLAQRSTLETGALALAFSLSFRAPLKWSTLAREPGGRSRSWDPQARPKKRETDPAGHQILEAPNKLIKRVYTFGLSVCIYRQRQY